MGVAWAAALNRSATYLTLGRSSIAWTHAVPVALWIDPALPSVSSVLLLLWGTFFYFASCFVNDLADIESDKINRRRRDSPLVSGEVSSLRVTHWAATTCLFVVFAVVLAPVSPVSKAMAVSAVVLTVYGNAYQKTSKVFGPLVMDTLYAITMVLLLLAARSAGGSQPGIGEVLCIASFGLVLLPLNAVAGNLKDFRVDQLSGAQTVAIRLGVQQPGEQHPFMLTKKYVTYVQGTLIAALSVLAASTLLSPSRGVITYLLQLAVAVIAVLSVWSMAKLLSQASTVPAMEMSVRRPVAILLVFVAFILTTAVYVPLPTVLYVTLSAGIMQLVLRIVRTGQR